MMQCFGYEIKYIGRSFDYDIMYQDELRLWQYIGRYFAYDALDIEKSTQPC